MEKNEGNAKEEKIKDNDLLFQEFTNLQGISETAGIKSEHCDVQTTKPNEDGTNKTNMEENESQVKMQELFLHEPSTNPDKNKREDRGCDTPRYSSDGELENLWKNIIYDCCVHTTAFLLCISIILITLITGYLLSNY